MVALKELPPGTRGNGDPEDSWTGAGGRELEGRNAGLLEKIEAGFPSATCGRHGEEAPTEHGLGGPPAASTEETDDPPERWRHQPQAVGEPLADLEELLGTGAGAQGIEVASSSGDAGQEPRFAEETGRRERIPHDPDQERVRERNVDDPAPGRNPRHAPVLQASPEEGRNPPQTPSAQKLGQVSDLDRSSFREGKEVGDREGGRERPGHARLEPLADGQFVPDEDRNGARPRRYEVADRYLGDRKRSAPLIPNLNPGPLLRLPDGLGPGAGLEDHPQPPRAATTRVRRSEVGSEDTCHMPRGKGRGAALLDSAHRPSGALE